MSLNTAFEERYKALNKEQKKAVDTTEGPVLVIAGPGSGKTELLTLRVANIIKKNLASPSQILCLTFTDNAAINMRERLSTLIGPDAYRVNIFTFHSFCNHIIGRYPEHFYNATHFTLANDLVRASILESLFKALPHKHPLVSFHPEEGYVYLRDVRDRIKHIKSGGYTAEEFKAILHSLKKEYKAVDEVIPLWPEGRITIKRINEFTPLVTALTELKNTTSLVLAKTLQEAVQESEALGKTEPLSLWKKKYLASNEEVIMLKDSYNLPKMEALAELYQSYEGMMHAQGYYDYDDMIIDVAHTLRENTFLRNEIEEQYHYILVDEFQDTNEAQMNLVRAITQSEIHEGRPNVLVVGDDDQAIYKFQGAEVSHIINFREATYKDVAMVVLDKNYRSTEQILALARSVITQGKLRLENKFEDITKELKAENSSLPKGDIAISSYASDTEEYTTVARRVRALLDAGQKPEEIAILARNHRDLKAILPFLDRASVPYEYIKKANVFDEPHVHQLIILCEYIASVLEPGHTKDYLLPTILSFPFFAIDRLELFTLSASAKKENIPWLVAAQKSESKAIQAASALLISLAGEVPTTPLEHLLDRCMNESGFKAHYFDKKKLKENPGDYLYFLASLRTFIDALREHKEGEVLTASDVAPFVEMHRTHDIALVSESVFTKNTSSVKLMTAHAAKGLEFACVCIIAAEDALWTKAPRTNKVPLPLVLSPLLTPAGDTEDDFIRLLYVAITRAKHTLLISSHDELVRYIASTKETHNEENKGNNTVSIEDHENMLGIFHAPLIHDEKALLQTLVKDYAMPVTHLNNFLDIKHGGPLYFVEQNVLRFPQPMNPSAVFGSAIHAAIEEMIMYPKYHGGELATLDHIISTFSRTLTKGRLPNEENLRQHARGEKVLTEYYEKRKQYFLPTDIVEVDMKHEGVVIDGAILTGKLDFLRIENNTYTVVDFKSGKSYVAWDEAGLTEEDKIKLHKYKQQLVVYKLLLENSTNYKLPVEKLMLEFVEDKNLRTLSFVPDEYEVEYTKKLISAVYKKIITCDFPDISAYEPTLKGIQAFENDLIAGAI